MTPAVIFLMSAFQKPYFISPSLTILGLADGSYAEFYNDTAFGTEEGGEIRISFFKGIEKTDKKSG